MGINGVVSLQHSLLNISMHENIYRGIVQSLHNNETLRLSCVTLIRIHGGFLAAIHSYCITYTPIGHHDGFSLSPLEFSRSDNISIFLYIGLNYSKLCWGRLQIYDSQVKHSLSSSNDVSWVEMLILFQT